jgi:hypothetical protein
MVPTGPRGASPLATSFLKIKRRRCKLQWRLRKAELKDIKQSRKEQIAELMIASLCAGRVRIRYSNENRNIKRERDITI